MAGAHGAHRHTTVVEKVTPEKDSSGIIALIRTRLQPKAFDQKWLRTPWLSHGLVMAERTHAHTHTHTHTRAHTQAHTNTHTYAYDSATKRTQARRPTLLHNVG